jgi:hypothetical protein
MSPISNLQQILQHLMLEPFDRQEDLLDLAYHLKGYDIRLFRCIGRIGDLSYEEIPPAFATLKPAVDEFRLPVPCE